MRHQDGRADPDRRFARIPATLCAAILFALSLPALVRVTLSVPVHAPLDRNEGWNAYVADRAAAGRPLYPDPPRFYANNYPPLSFFLVDLVPTADHLAAGRAISLTAFLAWVVLLAATAARLGASPGEAAFGAALFAALMLALSSYVGMNDPQMAGHVPQALAMYLIVGRQRAAVVGQAVRPAGSATRLAIAALLLSLGVFVKHSLAMLPLALTAWLFSIDRRAGWRLLTAGAVCALAGVAACMWWFGPGFVPQLETARNYIVRDAVRITITWLLRMSAFLALVVFLARRSSRDEGARFVVIYAIVSAVLALPLTGGVGVDWNVLFDANAACCLAAAVGVNRLAPERRGLAIAACLVLPIGAGLANMRSDWWSTAYWLSPRAQESAEADVDIASIEARPGPAFCSDLAFCWWAGRPEEVDAWGLEQRGLRNPALFDELAGLVEARYFAVIFPGTEPLRLGPRVDEAIRRHYVVERRGRYGPLLVPRDAPQPR